jgi:hypothetical protein
MAFSCASDGTLGGISRYAHLKHTYKQLLAYRILATTNDRGADRQE